MPGLVREPEQLAPELGAAAGVRGVDHDLTQARRDVLYGPGR
jgi:hypothetical protein